MAWWAIPYHTFSNVITKKHFDPEGLRVKYTHLKCGLVLTETTLTFCVKNEWDNQTHSFYYVA